MGQKILRKVIQVDGMTCTGCEMKIENRLKKLDGVLDAKAIFSSSNVYVTYDAGVILLDNIMEELEKLDYTAKNRSGGTGGLRQSGGRQPGGADESRNSGGNGKSGHREAEPDQAGRKPENPLTATQLLGIGVIIFAFYIIIQNTVGFNFIPQVSQNMGYGILFIVGLITSLHCMAMCGGINLSQCVSYRFGEAAPGKGARLAPSFLYNAGRVVSYTAIGGLAGALGSAVSFPGAAKGIIAILSGIFMVIMGLNMLNLFSWLRRLNPRMPRFFGSEVHKASGKRGPFIIGLLNGLMPCGPLQAMQIYALGTGSALAGAASMFFFSLGTLPLMFGFGAVSSFLSGRFTRRMMKVSAVLVMALGVVMLGRGLNLSGLSPGSAIYASSLEGNVARIEGGLQTVTTKLESGRYQPFVVQKGIPVRWTITAAARDINGCNDTLVIPKYGITQKLVPGNNLIEFTPEETGNIPYTCWMGMIGSSISVVEDIAKATENDIAQSAGDGSVGGFGRTDDSVGCCAR